MDHQPAPATSPSVGLFWAITDVGQLHLVTAVTPLNAAEPYGAALTDPRGHYDVWTEWQRLGPAGLKRRGLPAAIAYHEYEHFPRGRVVYETSSKHFIIYADRRLQSPATMARLRHLFGLAGKPVLVRSDPHYRSPPRPSDTD